MKPSRDGKRVRSRRKGKRSRRGFRPRTDPRRLFYRFFDLGARGQDRPGPLNILSCSEINLVAVRFYSGRYIRKIIATHYEREGLIS